MIKLFLTTAIALLLIIIGIWFMIAPEAYQKYFVSLYDKPSSFWISRVARKFMVMSAKGWWGKLQIRAQGLASFLVGSYIIYILFLE